ncbi:MAG: HAD-IIIC family phosphatase [Legionella sp.]
MKKNEPLTKLSQLLDYPINPSLILRQKHAIKKELLLKKDLIPKKIAILGGSTTAEVKAIWELFLLDIGVKPEFYESEFNRYYEEAVFENKALTTFKPDIIYIHVTNKNGIAYPKMTDSIEEVETRLHREQERYNNIWASLTQYPCPIIQNNFELPPHRILGNLDAYDYRGAVHYINRLNAFFAQETQSRSNMYLNDIHYLASTLGLAQWFDPHLWFSARYALSLEAIPHLAKSLAAIIGAVLGLSKKGLILDLDNTCWGGEIGESGLAGILIGKETTEAEVYTEFQRYVKTLKERGIILAVCSKNELENAQEGFKHVDTVLVHDDFAAFEANWDHKYRNILKISATLGLGLDNLLFIDDDPAERQSVGEKLPSLRVPDVGHEVLYFIDHIDKNYYFETVSLSKDDIQRSTYYKRKADSVATIEHFVRYEDYLDSLSMRSEIQPFSPIYLERITQLINKTNQFNLTTKRYTLEEIELIASRSDYISLYGRLEDHYGDNGLVSVLLGHVQGHECHVELWLMSCRVLQRTMEYALFDDFIARCKALGVKTIIGYYYKTAKNKLVAHLYEDLGFVARSINDTSSIWCLHVKDYTPRNKHIKVNE